MHQDDTSNALQYTQHARMYSKEPSLMHINRKVWILPVFMKCKISKFTTRTIQRNVIEMLQ